MQTRMILPLAISGLVHAYATTIGYAEIASVLHYLSKSKAFFEDPAFLFGLLASMGVLVVVMEVLQITFFCLVPVCVTLLLFWVAIRTLNDLPPFDQSNSCVAVIGVFTAFSVLGLLTFGEDLVNIQSVAIGLIVLNLVSAVCTAYLIWRLWVRASPKASDANAA